MVVTYTGVAGNLELSLDAHVGHTCDTTMSEESWDTRPGCDKHETYLVVYAVGWWLVVYAYHQLTDLMTKSEMTHYVKLSRPDY